ncbi:MAG TPA: VRR-NUC domain-containing protein [Steroidobacteraceae bacterium]|jgi:hypothetical protein|nr:VRR-NUC domain-containing protein [Steroidobacteraceae bacterium]
MDPVGTSPPLDRFYYLNNFQSVLRSLLERYEDLLSEEERGFIARFSTLPQVSRALFVRMAMRKGALFRASRLNYSEIGETEAAAVPLLEAEWVDARPNLSLDQLQGLLTKAELTRIFPLSARDSRKAHLVEILRDRFPETKPFQDWLPGTEDRVYQLLAATLCERFRLMFFGNFHQSWSEFVLVDLGIFAYERIEAPVQSRAFRTRADIDAFQQLQRCAELLHAQAPPELVAQSAPPRVLGCDWLEDRRQKLLFNIARHYERAGDPSSALAIYSVCTHPGARPRVIRLRDRLPRRLNRSHLPGAPGARVPSFELLLEAPASDRAVEWQVRDCLAQADGATVHYVENGLVNSLFGLLCWPAIFAPVAGAFFHDFHRAPADLSSSQFCARRSREFAECFAQLESGRYRTAIRQTYAAKMGIQSPFVAWNLVSEPLLERALACFPPGHLKLWFEWIVRDVQLNRAGFPDLVQFWPDQRRYRMIEVKGPGDRLQDNQRRLLEFCTQHQMPVAVCYVRWAGHQ